VKVAIVTDTHWGVRGDSLHFLHSAVRFHRQVLFPYLIENRITRIVHGGDLMDRRKFVNYGTASHVRKEFLDEAARLGIWIDGIAGNHDTYYKNTNDVNAWRELAMGRDDTTRVYTCSPTHILDGRVLLVPWICDENRDLTLAMVEGSRAEICIGHLELSGFKHYANSPEAAHGMDPSVFRKFRTTLSGHYHHKSSKGSIHYLGAPYEMTWSDYEDPRGFHVLDTETHELTFVENPERMHWKIRYDGRPDWDRILGIPSGTIVKVIVANRDDTVAFDKFMKQLDELGFADIQTVDDHLHVDRKISIDQAVVRDSDTPSLLRKAAAGNSAIEKILLKTYTEAISRR
jgi:DNA repair exonuclease SbcCD nuclease subunit